MSQTATYTPSRKRNWVKETLSRQELFPSRPAYDQLRKALHTAIGVAIIPSFVPNGPAIETAKLLDALAQGFAEKAKSTGLGDHAQMLAEIAGLLAKAADDVKTNRRLTKFDFSAD